MTILPSRLLIVAAAGAVIAASPAEDETIRRAREEVERQLREMPQIPPPRLEIHLVAIDQPGYRLEEAVFLLDGRPVKTPALAELQGDGKVRVFSGAVSEGRHEVSGRLKYSADAGIFSYMQGYQFSIGRNAAVETRRGLLTAVELGAHVDNRIEDWKRRISVEVNKREEMLAPVESGDLPPPPPRLVPLERDQPPAPAAVVAAARATEEDDDVRPPARGKRRSKKPKRVASAKALAKAAPAPAPAASPPGAIAAATAPRTSPAAVAPIAEPQAAARVVPPNDPLRIAARIPAATDLSRAQKDPGEPAAAEPKPPIGLGVVLLAGGGALVAVGIAVALRRRRRLPEI